MRFCASGGQVRIKAKTFAICDVIQDTPEGYVVQGPRREFLVPSLPGSSGRIVIPIHVSLFPSEYGKHRVRISVRTTNNIEAMDTYEVAGEFGGDITMSFEHVLRFPVAGNYVARLAVDTKTVAQWPIVVKVYSAA